MWRVLSASVARKRESGPVLLRLPSARNESEVAGTLDALRQLGERAMNYFRTKRLHLAAYIHASTALQFSHAENDVHQRAVFVFLDPTRVGPEVEQAYESGAVVPAITFSASLTYIRRQISALEENGEKSNVSHVRR